MLETRHATVQDIPAIRRIAHDAWYATYPGIISEAQIAYMLDKLYAADVLAENIAQATQPALLAVEEDAILGFGAYSEMEEPEIYKLRKLYIDPKQHKKGIGRRVLEDILLIAQQNNAQALRVNVNRENPARHFYERMGFTILCEEDIPYGPFFLHDYVMEKSL